MDIPSTLIAQMIHDPVPRAIPLAMPVAAASPASDYFSDGVGGPLAVSLAGPYTPDPGTVLGVPTLTAEIPANAPVGRDETCDEGGGRMCQWVLDIEI